MKLILVLCLVTIVVAIPPPTNVELLRNVYVDDARGNYKFGYAQSDGTTFDQEGTVVNEGREDESIAVKGGYSWVGPDGVTYSVNYEADDEGFHPQIEQGPGGALSPALLQSLAG